MIEILSMYALRRIVNRDDRIILKFQRIFLLFLLHLITILLIPTTTVNAEEQKRSSTLNIEKTTDGDTERLDYIDENGNITYAADKHYATVIKKKSGNTLLEEYFDGAGKPAVHKLLLPAFPGDGYYNESPQPGRHHRLVLPQGHDNGEVHQ